LDAGGKRPEAWDAITGTTRKLIAFMEENGRTSVRLKFEPHQSLKASPAHPWVG